MPSTAALRARGSREHAHVLFIEGIEYAWTDNAELAGTSWIGTTYGARTVIDGLVLPDGGWTESVDVRGDGLVQGGQMTIGLIDRDGATLVSLFSTGLDEDDDIQIGQTVTPTTPPSQMEALSGVGTAVVVDARGKHLGLERIGEDGERRQFWIFPEDGWGLDHPVTEWSATDPIDDDELPALYASVRPRVFAGRRVALYEVYRDDDGTWRSWRDTYDGGGLVWIGTMRDEGEIEDLRMWQTSCDGFPSWLASSINSTRPSRPYPVIGAKVSLGESKRGIAVWFDRSSTGNSGGDVYEQHTGAFFDDDLTAAEDTPAGIAGAVSTEVTKALTGGAGSTAGAQGDYGVDGAGGPNWASFSLDQVSIRVNANASLWRGSMHVCLHREVWAALGWDLEFQRQLPRDDPRYVIAYPVAGQAIEVGVDLLAMRQETVPGAGYWVVVFTTDRLSDVENPPRAYRHNEGNDRVYRPQYSQGAMYLRGEGRQEVVISSGAGPYLPAQNGVRPSQGARVGGNDCNAAGLWLFEGVRRLDREEEDGEDYAQVALCSWFSDSRGRVGVDDDGRAAIFVERWLDPRVFGLDFRRLSGTWGFSLVQEEPVTATPLGVVGSCDRPNDAGAPDHVHQTIVRLLCSTGTGSSSGSSNAPVYVQGANNVPFAAIFGGLGDYEVADLGLGIPAEHVDIGSLYRAMQSLPSFPSALSAGKYAFIGAVDSRDVLGQMLGSRGLAMGIRRRARGPALSFWSIYGAWDPGESVLTINAATDVRGERGRPDTMIAKQSIRWTAPIDRWSLEYGGTLGEGASMEVRALDQGARGRSGRVVHSGVDLGLVDPQLWEGTGGKPWHALWVPDWRTMHQRVASRWYSERHFPLTIDVSRNLDVGLGDLVTYTDVLPASPAGEYGLVGYLARVVSVTRRPYAEAMTLTLLVQATPPSSRRHFGPIARVWGTDISGGTGTLYCAAPGVSGWDAGNWSRHGYDRSDVAGFAEPAWSDVGGVCRAVIYQSFDGLTFGDAVNVVVGSVDEGDHTCQVSAVSGVLYRDTEKYMVLRAYGDQDADSWVRATYGIITDETGDASGVAGWRFE